MKKILDKFKSYLIINKKMMLFLFIIVLIGIITGSLFTIFLNVDDKTLIKNSLDLFFNNCINDKLNYLEAFKNSLFSNYFYTIIIWLLGISLIGAVFAVPIAYFKSFILGFTISSIITNYGLKGVIIAILYIFPHLIFNLLIIMFITHYSVILSFKIFKSFFNKGVVDFKFIFRKYFIILIICLIILMLTSLYEGFVIPLIFKTFKGLITL